jgi:RNA polymerase sigma-70 factor (ECF subfamily)
MSNPAEPSDVELVAAAQRGDRAAIEALLERHEPTIYRFGLRLCGDEESAREVLQETMLAAFKNLSSFRGEASVSTWLYQIAKSFCIKERRRPAAAHAAGAEPPREDLADPGPGPDSLVHARRIGAALAAGIAALGDEQREALVLRDVEGLSAEEAAAVAGVQVGALKSRLHRARVELRAHLATILGEASEVGGPPPCAALAQELGAYAGADIDQATCEQIERHLETCSACRGACEALKKTVGLCKRLPAGEVPQPVRAAVRRALRAATAGEA